LLRAFAAGALGRLEARLRGLGPLAILALPDPSPGGGGLIVGAWLTEALTDLLPEGPIEALPVLSPPWPANPPPGGRW